MTDRFFCAAVVSALMFAGSAFAQSNDPAWLDDLQDQMQRDKGCLVDLFFNIGEGELGSGRYYEARVQCRDGRLFDASRIDPKKEFEIKACEIVVC